MDPAAGEKRRVPLIALLLFAMRGAGPGRRFLVTFCRCRQKVTRLQAEIRGFKFGKADAVRDEISELTLVIPAQAGI